MPLTALLTPPPRPPHGGNLHAAIARFGGAPADWLDLSAALNPQPYPPPPLPDGLWQALPPPPSALLDAARSYYRTDALLASAGSQAAIHTLPRLRRASQVTLAAPMYAEHRWGWQAAGHRLCDCPHQAEALLHAADHSEVLVLCQPNNPGGECVEPEVLLACARRLAERGGWLLVDEAFIDATPEASVISQVHAHPNLIVLRSLGKFFGLAGLRLGMVAAHPAILAALDAALGPWTISAAAQHIARAALTDADWIAAARQRLPQDSARLAALLAEHGLASVGTALFRTCPHPHAEALHQALAAQRVWTRVLPGALRFGLPGEEAQWQQLAQSLAADSCRHVIRR